jgi:hypothetical protein
MRLYAEFGVESAPRALLDPRAWVPVLRGILRSFNAVLHKQQPVPPINPKGGRFGLPADFLVASDGRVVACKYGSYAYDQWSVDDILTLARATVAGPRPQVALRISRLPTEVNQNGGFVPKDELSSKILAKEGQT